MVGFQLSQLACETMGKVVFYVVSLIFLGEESIGWHHPW